LQHPVALRLLSTHVFTAISQATHTENFKTLFFSILKLSIVSDCVYLFNTYVAQHVSAYLAIIRCIKIAGEIAALLCTVVTRITTFS
jgi:hypothetical protein